MRGGSGWSNEREGKEVNERVWGAVKERGVEDVMSYLGQCTKVMKKRVQAHQTDCGAASISLVSWMIAVETWTAPVDFPSETTRMRFKQGWQGYTSRVNSRADEKRATTS